MDYKDLLRTLRKEIGFMIRVYVIFMMNLGLLFVAIFAIFKIIGYLD